MKGYYVQSELILRAATDEAPKKAGRRADFLASARTKPSKAVR